GDPQRADRLATHDTREVLALLRLAAVARQPGRGHVRVHEDAERDASRAAARHLLSQDDAREEIAAAAPIVDGELEPEESQVAQPPPERSRDLPRRLPVRHLRRDLLLDEGADGAPQHLVL